MPSSEPLETTIATFASVSGVAGSGCSVICVMTASSDAAVRLRDAGDRGGQLRRALGEERVELLDRHAGRLAQRPDGRGGAGGQVALAHEPDDLPVAVGQ